MEFKREFFISFSITPPLFTEKAEVCMEEEEEKEGMSLLFKITSEKSSE